MTDEMKIAPFETPIYVTKPFLPPIEEFTEGLSEIWDTHLLTNNGPLVQRLAQQLSQYFSDG